MSHDVNELGVFIASPGDLSDERAILRSLEADLNSKFAHANIRVRMTGWEERPPAYGRPQSQINPMVDACDVFIGLLRRKWGSHTGTHNSGFGEEFERALERRQESGISPEISLFFASLSQDEIDDAGPELTRVLTFQERVRAERIGIYRKFAGPNDLGKQVEDLLERHLIDLVISQSASHAPAGPESLPEEIDGPASGEVEEGSTAAQEDNARYQLSTMLGTLQDLLSDREPEPPLDNDRLELIGTALGRDRPVLGTHLANRLYQRRGELALIGGEHSVWVRTLLGDVGRSTNAADRVIPGWATFQRDHVSFEPMMLGFAMEAGPVGVGAAQSMQRLGMRPATLWPPVLRPDPTLDGDPGNDVRLNNWTNLLNRHKGRSACMTYLLQDLATSDEEVARHLDVFLGAIQQGRGDLNDESRQFIANSRSALAGDPSPLAEALGYSPEVDAQWRLVLRQVEKIDQKRLSQLASQRFNPVARLASLRAGIEADCLSENTVKNLLFEDDPEVIGVLLDAAQSDPDIARRYLSHLGDKPDGKLVPTGLEARLQALNATQHELTQLDQEQSLSNVPWEALTYINPDGMAGTARTVLETDASDFRDRLRAVIGEEHVVITYLAEDRKRIAAALLARRERRTTQDVDLVLQWFEELAASEFVHDFAFAVLEKVADEATLGRIKEILARHQDSTGIRFAYNRICGPLAPAIAPLFLDHETEHFREPAMLWHVSQDQRSDKELQEALFDKNDEVRAVAAQFLASRLPDDEVKTLLEDYSNAGRAFWYNVIAILDEHLYAPSTGDVA